MLFDYYHPIKSRCLTNAAIPCGLALLLAAFVAIPSVHAESLFRASASRSDHLGYTPHSLYTQPTPKAVGDVLTIKINEQGRLQSQGELKITRDHQINENGTNMVNTILHKIGVPDNWSFPSFNNMDNSNVLSSKAETLRRSTMQENVSCQVIEVLPNGNLVVQGQKAVMYNKERQDLLVTGIINPYYVDRFNTIDSKYVANMQLLIGGKGTVARQQNDGLASKIYQFFN
jgi:flagellar L-ring protein precursor FlgH